MSFHFPPPHTGNGYERTDPKSDLRIDICHADEHDFDFSPAPEPHPPLKRSSSLSVKFGRMFHRRTTSDSSINSQYEKHDPLYWLEEAPRVRPARPSTPTTTTPTAEQGKIPYFLEGVPHLVHDVGNSSGLRVKLTIDCVVNGTWYGKPAAFISFTVAHEDVRVIESEITIKVLTGGLGEMRWRDYDEQRGLKGPTIVKFAPKQILAPITHVENTTAIGVEGDMTPTTPMGKFGGFKVRGSRAITTIIDKRQSIKGHTTSECGSANNSIFKLKACENPCNAQGIPTHLQFALVVKTRGRPLIISTNVEPKLPPPPMFQNYVDEQVLNVPVFLDTKKDWIPAEYPYFPTAIDEWEKRGLWTKLIQYAGEEESVLIG